MTSAFNALVLLVCPIAAPTNVRRRIYHYTTSHAICQEFLRKNIAQIFFPKLMNLCAKLRLDFWVQMWYNISVSRGEVARPQPKKISKIFQKPIDKSPQMWYNISVKGRETKTSTNRGVGKVIQ